MNLFAMLAQDENIDPALRRLFAAPKSDQANQLIRRDATHRFERQFAAEPHTPSAFAPLSAERRREIRDEELECERDDARRADLFGSEE